MPPPPEPDPTSVRVPRNDPPPRSLSAMLQKKPNQAASRAGSWADRAVALVIVGILLVVAATYLYR